MVAFMDWPVLGGPSEWQLEAGRQGEAPLSKDFISSADRVSSLALASLTAAAIKSSRTSLSPSAIRLSSIPTDFAKPFPVKVTVTMPPPACPSTSMAAIFFLQFLHFRLQTSGLLHHVAKILHDPRTSLSLKLSCVPAS